jgi:glycosyltransferase involved in cell wall biosynthesis/peptidoglycan/xylan/chitin deacetylase (PgdA/CDA1 family)/SAM-dependent methyltransferase
MSSESMQTPPVRHSRTPLVSAIVIFLNEEKYLSEAIESLFAQTYPYWELILVDDGSTDASTQIAREISAAHRDRVRYLEHNGHMNRGMSASRNLGLRHARGDFIAFLDADDVWLPEKLERQVAILLSQPSVGMVCAATKYWFSWTGKPADGEKDYVQALQVETDVVIAPPRLLTALHPLGEAPAPCQCSLLIRRDVIERVGGYEDAFLGFYEDQAFLTKVYLSEPVFVSAICTDRYRIHPESCSALVRKSGTEDQYRQRYLEWFSQYLQERQVTDPEVRDAIENALAPYKVQREHGWRWYIRVAGGNVARLSHPPSDPQSVRIEIKQNRTDAAFDTQLNLPSLRLFANRQYRFTLRARADRPRTIGVGVAMGHSPWTNLGMYATVEIGPEWRDFEQQFQSAGDERDARIHVDAGGSDVSVELTAVTLRDLGDDVLVVQEKMGGQTEAVARDRPDEPDVPLHGVEFGSFRRLTPISRDFGCDRGQPIDRYYIENFLEKHSTDVRGRVLEVGESTYTRRFGGERVTKADILHVTEGEPQATIIADLAAADHVPSNAFDCIIVTQTLQLIYDVHAAVRTLYRILKPGGVLLATFPGISQTYDHEWSATWYWNFTTTSARRLFEDTFSHANTQVESFGNVLAAVSFLHGLALEELTSAELDHRDPGYDVTLAVRAVKPADPAARPSASEVMSRHTNGPVTRGAAQVRSAILMYHRVAEGGMDPFSLCVTADNFSEQLEVLRKRAAPVSLEALLETSVRGAPTAATTVITFDDGYADNLLHAKPRLERACVPATVFIVTGYIGGAREFWWDELERILLEPGRVPRVLELSIGGVAHRWSIDDAEHYPKHQWERDRNWRVHEHPPTARHATFVAVWRALQFLPDEERQPVLRELADWAGIQPGVRPSHRQLSANEIRDLASRGLVNIGAHTVTHPVLSSLPIDAQRREIVQSKSDLEAILGRPVTSFSYPFGSAPDYTAETMAIVREAGFSSACSTRKSAMGDRPDLFQLPRLQVEDWDGEEFARRLDAWMFD